ncbi:MAG: hypothetical protein RIT03_1112 [Bacteroidota bacterium]|jgi:hypothetical protein
MSCELEVLLLISNWGSILRTADSCHLIAFSLKLEVGSGELEVFSHECPNFIFFKIKLPEFDHQR